MRRGIGARKERGRGRGCPAKCLFRSGCCRALCMRRHALGLAWRRGSGERLPFRVSSAAMRDADAPNPPPSSVQRGTDGSWQGAEAEFREVQSAHQGGVEQILARARSGPQRATVAARNGEGRGSARDRAPGGPCGLRTPGCGGCVARPDRRLASPWMRVERGP